MWRNGEKQAWRRQQRSNGSIRESGGIYLAKESAETSI
jgi:hypothetical protein